MILDHDFHEAVVASKLHLDSAFRCGELHGVGHHVDDHLLEAFGIDDEKRNAAIEAASRFAPSCHRHRGTASIAASTMPACAGARW